MDENLEKKYGKAYFSGYGWAAEAIQSTSPSIKGRIGLRHLEEIFPGIAAKGVVGYRGIELLRRSLPEEVEFITIMGFEQNWAKTGSWCCRPSVCWHRGRGL